ncbi:MAG: hypothetical protein JWN11_2067 [Hyphomicrobiales bacterium]|nr:hypothetical protein [Hyphomicrobiales bacterium]
MTVTNEHIEALEKAKLRVVRQRREAAARSDMAPFLQRQAEIEAIERAIADERQLAKLG